LTTPTLESLSAKVIANPFDVAAWQEYAAHCRAVGMTGWADLADYWISATDEARGQMLLDGASSWPVAAPIAVRLLKLLRPAFAKSVGLVVGEIRDAIGAMTERAKA
jgi:hypothetical protein